MPYLVVIINISCSIKVKKCMITWNCSNASVLTSNLKHIRVQMKHFRYTKLSKELSRKFCNLFCGWCIFKALIKFLGISCKLAWALYRTAGIELIFVSPRWKLYLSFMAFIWMSGIWYPRVHLWCLPVLRKCVMVLSLVTKGKVNSNCWATWEVSKKISKSAKNMV